MKSLCKEQLENINLYIQSDNETPDDGVVHDVQAVLSEERPEPRDILIGILMKNEEKSIKLLRTLPKEGCHVLNVLNLLIILHVSSGQYYIQLLEKGHSMDKSGMYGTTLFDLLCSEIEETGGDIQRTVEGFVFNAEALAEEYDISI